MTGSGWFTKLHLWHHYGPYFPSSVIIPNCLYCKFLWTNHLCEKLAWSELFDPSCKGKTKGSKKHKSTNQRIKLLQCFFSLTKMKNEQFGLFDVMKNVGQNGPTVSSSESHFWYLAGSRLSDEAANMFSSLIILQNLPQDQYHC